MNTAVATSEILSEGTSEISSEVGEENFLNVFLQNIHREGWLGSAFIRDDESKRIKAFFVSENQQSIGDEESVVEGWHFHLVTRNETFFEQRMSGDHRLLFEMATMKIAADEAGVFKRIQKSAMQEIASFTADPARIKTIEKSLHKAVVGAESCKKNTRNLSTMIIISKVEELLELLFLKNSKPFSGTVYAYRHYRDLENVPNGFPQMFEALLESSECIMRTERFSHCVRLLTKL